MSILPRQARDKHREIPKRDALFAGTLFYGTYALAIPGNPGDNVWDGCGNW
jgi:hypothetical protein